MSPPSPRPPTPAPAPDRRIGWAAVAVLSLAIGGYAVTLIVTGFAFVPPEVASNRFPTALGLRTHITASAVALLVGPFQFLRPLDVAPRRCTTGSAGST